MVSVSNSTVYMWLMTLAVALNLGLAGPHHRYVPAGVPNKGTLPESCDPHLALLGITFPF